MLSATAADATVLELFLGILGVLLAPATVADVAVSTARSQRIIIGAGLAVLAGLLLLAVVAVGHAGSIVRAIIHPHALAAAAVEGIGDRGSRIRSHNHPRPLGRRSRRWFRRKCPEDSCPSPNIGRSDHRPSSRSLALSPQTTQAWGPNMCTLRPRQSM